MSNHDWTTRENDLLTVVRDALGDMRNLSALVTRGLSDRIDQAKSTAVGAQRAVGELRRGNPGLEPSGLVKVLVAAVRAKTARLSIDAFLIENPDATTAHYKALVAGGSPMRFKAVTNPAITTVQDWAGMFVGRQLAPMAALAPNSAYAALQGRASVLPLSFDGVGVILLPSRSAGDLAGGFHSEAEPLQVKKATLSSSAVVGHMIGVISTFTKEMSKSANFEAMVRAEIAFDTAAVLDTAFLSDDAATAIAPAGILSAATSLPPSAETSKADAFAEDLGTLATAIPNAADLVYISQADVRTRAIIYGGAGISALPWIISPAAPPKSVIAIDAASLAMVESDFAFDVTEEAAIHEESATPLPIATGTSGAGAITAAPVRSLWQTDCVGIRLLSLASWALRGAGRVAIVEDVTW